MGEALGAGGVGTAKLSAEGWARTLRNYLLPTLSFEVARLVNLPETAVSLQASFLELGIESSRGMSLQGRLRLALGINIEFAALMTHSIESLTEAIIGGRSGSATAATAAAEAAAALDEAAAPAVNALAPFELLPMQSLYFMGRSMLALKLRAQARPETCMRPA